MALEIRKAERKKAKLRLGISAPSGAGKTWGALKIAFGIGGKVGMIDTEHGSGDLYAHLGDYDIINLSAPYTCERYVEAIKAFENAGYTTIIIDSLSHAWAMEGGLLQKHATESQKTNNSYTAWRNVTPQHNSLVEAMLQSKCHIIATMRAKQEYATEKNDQGKTVVRKLGLAPVQREGMEYEFTAFLDIDSSHNATSSKDRTSLLDGRMIQISEDTGKMLLEWLNTGKDDEIEKAEKEKLFWENELNVTVDGLHTAKTQEELKNRFMAAKERFKDKPKFLEAVVKAKDTRKKYFTTPEYQEEVAAFLREELNDDIPDFGSPESTVGTQAGDVTPSVVTNPAPPLVELRKFRDGKPKWEYWVSEAKDALNKCDDIGAWLKVHDKQLEALKVVNEDWYKQVNEVAIERMG